jgi:hypothetical protein
MGGLRLETYQRFVDIVDGLFGLCLDRIFKTEMKIKAKHELRLSVAGLTQQQSVQVLQGKAKKACFFKSSKEGQNVIKRTQEVVGKGWAQISSWTRDP